MAVIKNEEPPVVEENFTDSILNSVKKNLGYPVSETCFDSEILMNINSAIFTLRQLGIGPEEGFSVSDSTTTYRDFLGEKLPLYQSVKMYLYFRTKLGFDPPQSSFVLECYKEQIKELEWRLMIENESSKEKEGEISK